MKLNSIQSIAMLIAFVCGPIQFAQGQSRAVDIIIAVDNSASMVDEVNEVQLNLNPFVDQILSVGLDVRLVLISADSTHPTGICVSSPLGSGSCPIDENKPTYTHIPQTVGSNDALNTIINTHALWAAEMRAEAIKHVIVVSDDNSTLTATEFNSAFLALDASHGGYQFHAIAGTEGVDRFDCLFVIPDNICCQDETPLCNARGQNYIDLTVLTGGTFNNLCLQDFDPFFDDIAAAVIQSVPAAIKINEIFPDPIGPDTGNEWIELYSDDNYAFNIGGWSIGAATSEWSTVFTLPDPTIINPGAFLVIGGSLVDFADYNFPPDDSPDLGNATISGDAVRIVSADGVIIDTVVYGDNNTDSFLDDSGNIASSLASIGISGESIARNYDGVDTDASGDDFSVSSPTPGSSNSLTCDVVTVSYITEYGSASYEACDVLVLGPGFVAEELSNVTANSGWEIDFMPGFLVEHSATFSANVCGQSLCETSPSPMPYGCHSCVDTICKIDPTCCDTDFDEVCLEMVDSKCGLVCEMETYSIDFCRLQHPPSVKAPSGSDVDVFGRVWVAGVTDVDQTTNDPTPGLIGYVGYGPDNSSPSDNWTWTAGIPNPNYIVDSEPSLDEYKAVLTLPESGEYDFAFRFSGDNGNTFTYCDLNEGSANGYSPADAGQLTVVP